MDVARFNRAAQRRAGRQQAPLPDHFVQRGRPHALGQRLERARRLEQGRQCRFWLCAQPDSSLRPGPALASSHCSGVTVAPGHRRSPTHIRALGGVNLKVPAGKRGLRFQALKPITVRWPRRVVQLHPHQAASAEAQPGLLERGVFGLLGQQHQPVQPVGLCRPR